MEDGASGAGRWFCGPASNRRAYAVRDIGALRDEATVLQAERLADPADPDGYVGTVSLKLHTDPEAVDAALVAERLDRVASIDHDGLGRPIESFLGPGLAHDPETAESDGDVFYVAARWEDGRPLAAVAPLAPAAALGVVRDVAGAVAALHDQGLSHRDIHPGNVIVRPDGSGVIIDFGTVRPDDGTATATIAGVVGFIAPEAVTGGSGRAADRWSVGMLAVHALLGHPQGSTPAPALRRELEAALAGPGDSARAAARILEMVDADPARRPVDLVAWVDRVTDDLDRRLWRRRLVATLAAIVVLAGLLAVALTTIGDRRADPAAAAPAAPSGCPGGAVPQRLGAPFGSCWAGPPQQFARGSIRPVADPGGHDLGMYVTAPDGRAVYLTETMWRSYTEISGKRAIDSPTYGGYPVGVDVYTDPDAVAIRLDNGGLVIGPRADTQLFWVPAQGVTRWTASGGLRGQLGFPSSNLKVDPERAVIEFQHGELSVTADRVQALYAGADVPIDLTTPADPTEGLDLAAVRAHLIRQWGGTAWWVDPGGVRHWVPDHATWSCLGGDAAVYPGAHDLHGWTVWLFPLGPPATCAGAPARGPTRGGRS